MPLELSKVPLIPPDPTTLPVGGRLGYFHLNWKFLRAHPSVIKTLEFGLQLPIGSVRIPLSRVPLINSQYSSLGEECSSLPSCCGYAAQRSNLGGQGFFIPGFLQQTFPCGKEDWRMEASNRFESFKSLSGLPHFQDGNYSVHQKLPSSWPVDNFSGPQGCILPHSHGSFGSQTAQVSSLGQSVPVCGYAFWPSHSSQGIHYLSQGSEKDGLEVGHLSSHVPRRLAYQSQQLSGGSFCNSNFVGVDSQAGVDCKQGEVRFASKASFHLPGPGFRPVRGVCYPTEARFLPIQEAIHPLLFNPHTAPRQVMHLLGLLASTEKLVPQGRLHIQHLQFHLRKNYNCHLKGALDSPISLDPSVKVHLRWWLQRNNVMAQAPLHPPKYVTSIYTDASAQGWGAHCAHMIAQGHWSTQQSKLHINVLELKAVLLALKTFVPQLSLHQRIIQVASDNTTVCAYINKLGGTRSWDMFALTWHLFAFCRKNKVVLTARHVPGVMNLVADQLFRSQQTLHTEWSLNPKIFRWLSQIDFQPQIDLFATRFNHKLPQYVSPVPDPKALAVDALAMNWSGLHLYSFPPTALCPLVVKKLINSQSCRMLLVTPLWETKEWLQDLLALSIRRPIALPLKIQPHLKVF